MKTRLSAIAVLCLSLGMTSCSYKVFPVEELERGYNESMITDSEIEAMSEIAIYISERDVPAGYRTISFAEIKSLGRGGQASQFYKKAVMKASEAGGNAIIVTGPGQFKIIEIPERHKIVRMDEPAKPIRPDWRRQPREDVQDTPKPEKDVTERQRVERKRPERQKEGTPLMDKLREEKQKIGDRLSEKSEARAEAKAETKVETKPDTKVRTSKTEDNPIFNADNLQWFTSKYIYTATEQEQVQIVQALKDEIRSNIKACKTMDEAEFISEKIDVLEAYNKALPTPSGTQAAEINGFRNALINAVQPKGKSTSDSKLIDGSKLKDSARNLLDKIKKQ